MAVSLLCPDGSELLNTSMDLYKVRNCSEKIGESTSQPLCNAVIVDTLHINFNLTLPTSNDNGLGKIVADVRRIVQAELPDNPSLVSW